MLYYPSNNTTMTMDVLINLENSVAFVLVQTINVDHFREL